MATAVYPGSFDPVTRGHLDIIKRASKVMDKLVIGVLKNSAKNPLFTLEERVALLQECTKDIPNVSVVAFEGLSVDFAKKNHATVNETQIAQTNHALMPGVDTVFFATSIRWGYLSSTIVREAASYGSDISKFVTPPVQAALEKKFAELREQQSDKSCTKPF